ncbi:MAG TPA: hypothetical protein VE673_10360 [Pseudonocardiaceae bacterium]|jgi:hypothetical protein|nr:hypothetical protein [Pseudonocardiaceae bacterium]
MIDPVVGITDWLIGGGPMGRLIRENGRARTQLRPIVLDGLLARAAPHWSCQ